MKNVFLILFILAFVSFAGAQESAPTSRSIQVNGSAEMEITPDEIYFTIVLEEYMEDKEKKKPMEKLEEQLKAAIVIAGIPKENLTIENVYGQNWERKRRNKDFLEKRSYILKLNDASAMDGILDKIDQKAIESVYITRFSHSKIEEYRKQLKIQAIKNAKEKAKYLLEAIGEDLDRPLLIKETENSFPLPVVWDESQVSNSTYMSYQKSSGESDLGVKKIKLRMEIYAEFGIK